MDGLFVSYGVNNNNNGDPFQSKILVKQKTTTATFLWPMLHTGRIILFQIISFSFIFVDLFIFNCHQWLIIIELNFCIETNR